MDCVVGGIEDVDFIVAEVIANPLSKVFDHPWLIVSLCLQDRVIPKGHAFLLFGDAVENLFKPRRNKSSLSRDLLLIHRAACPKREAKQEGDRDAKPTHSYSGEPMEKSGGGHRVVAAGSKQGCSM